MFERFFEWDPHKAQVNLRKHGVDFAVAVLAFDDPLAITRQDRIEHGEYRWQTIGMVEGYLLLIVAHTLHFDAQASEVVRIISARRVDRAERIRYENGEI